MGRSSGPKGPDPSSAASSRWAVSSRRTPTAGPNRPANMFPCTNAPRLPNIGLTSTAGSPGIRPRKNCLSSSLGFGISMRPPDGPPPQILGPLRSRLDDAERGALRVAHSGDAADRGVERLDQDGAAPLSHLGPRSVRLRDLAVPVAVGRHAPPL